MRLTYGQLYTLDRLVDKYSHDNGLTGYTIELLDQIDQSPVMVAPGTITLVFAWSTLRTVCLIAPDGSVIQFETYPRKD